MSTTEKQVAATSHGSPEPASAELAFGDVTDERSAYAQFFDAIEQLEDDRVLFGTASLEAQISRVRVDRMRELAAAEWERRRAA
jgi:hypothetical protein